MGIMTKMPVLPGVWWVEVPERDLKLLCGAPMDVTKHLMRRGLVRKVEKSGTVFEVGPNAILLSDVTVQNGRFWNLAEFPVLHMMFRQGMVLPNHPGNTGRRPMLIGLESRTRAVLDYIYRGTYGLVSRDEMRRYGILEDDLEELWALKLKFASGSIKTPQELIEVLSLDGDSVSPADGVTVRRRGVNQYSIDFDGESLDIDMNLPAGSDWAPSYTLVPRPPNDGYFSVTHIGEGNGWDPERPCMGSLVTYHCRRYLIDCGPGIDASLEALGIDTDEITGLVVTHVHDDHFAGLTSLLRGNRRIPVYATRPVMATLAFKCAALLERPIDFVDHLLDIRYLEENVWNDVDGLEIRPTSSPHPLETTVMFFRALWEGGYRSYAHLADIVSYPVLDGFVGPDGISAEFRDRVFREYARVADVKKVDAGRGLIHGFAEDFRDDESPRLILSHTEGPLSDKEKDIGAAVGFGQTDVLIPDRGNRVRENAARLLTRSLPGLPEPDIERLMNSKVQTIEPETPLIRRNRVPDHLYLIITGTVVSCIGADHRLLRFAPGGLVGEDELLNRSESACPYRTATHVTVMRIPADLYIHALRHGGLLERRVEQISMRRFLAEGAFPASVVSCPRLDDLAAQAEQHSWTKRRRADIDADRLYIIRSGSVGESGNGGRGRLESGDWFNVPGVLPIAEGPAKLRWSVESDSRLVSLPGSLLREIPVLGWTLAEAIAAS